MGFLAPLLTIIGLAVFEIVTSIDNAIINANVLSTMSQKARKWFLLWGILFAVFVIRGILPFLIIYLTNPSHGFWQVLGTTFSGSAESAHIIEESSRVLLIGGGVFLVFLFLHWVFLETKNFVFRFEKFLESQGVWFYAVVSILLTVIVWASVGINPTLAIGAVVGSTGFFIIHGVREQAEKQERNLIKSSGGMSDVSKIIYLEILDATFSIDGVVGAFAFTFSVILILIGNGIGAVVLRQLTVGNINRIKQYVYLKNGAMYSIAILGTIMLLDGFGYKIPNWISPLTTLLVISYFFYRSKSVKPTLQ